MTSSDCSRSQPPYSARMSFNRQSSVLTYVANAGGETINENGSGLAGVSASRIRPASVILETCDGPVQVNAAPPTLTVPATINDDASSHPTAQKHTVNVVSAACPSIESPVHFASSTF